MLNVPPLTLAVAALLSVCFAVLQNNGWAERFISACSFVPQEFSRDAGARPWSVVSYALLHFGWAHIVVNLTGLLAFGSGVERMAGRKIFCAVLLLGTLAGSLGYWAIMPQSEAVLGGASAGISALFGAALPLLMKRRDMVIASLVFIVTNIALGQAGVPGEPDAAIAWQAHLFGFFTGMAITLVTNRKRRVCQ